MKYDITKTVAPAMPTLGKGTECIKLLLSQTSFDMHAPLLPMLPPILGAKISGVEIQYPDLTWKEMCGIMANLVAESGGNKGQLSCLVEAICHDFPLQNSCVQESKPFDASRYERFFARPRLNDEARRFLTEA